MTHSMESTLNLPDMIGSQAISSISGPVAVDLLAPKARLNLRIVPEKLEEASQIFGLAIPSQIHGYVVKGERSALCLGPNEWHLQVPEHEKEELIAAFAAFYERCPHSLTDISDRQVTVKLTGEKVADLLSIACPRDLGQLSAGSGTRTLFDSVEVLLVRHEQDHFEMEVWRSFLPHVWALLHIGNRELAGEEQLAD